MPEFLPASALWPAPRAGKVFRRLVGQSISKDFLHWEKPWRIFTPDKQDDGLLEFYGMGGMHQRGTLTIGLVRVLRDDLACDDGGPKDGIGYSVLQLSARLLDSNRLRIEALPHLQALANLTGERTNLGILHRNKVLYLAGVEKPSLPTIYSRFGQPLNPRRVADQERYDRLLVAGGQLGHQRFVSRLGGWRFSSSRFRRGRGSLNGDACLRDYLRRGFVRAGQ